MYEVQQENSRTKSKLLHRNMLLPFQGLPIPTEPNPPKPTRRPVVISDDSYDASSSSSSSTDLATPSEHRTPRYVIPQRRRQTPKSSSKHIYGGTSKEASGSEIGAEHVAAHSSADPGYFHTSSSLSSRSSSPDQCPRRGYRIRRPPLWMGTGDWQIQQRPYILHIDPYQIAEMQTK